MIIKDDNAIPESVYRLEFRKKLADLRKKHRQDDLEHINKTRPIYEKRRSEFFAKIDKQIEGMKVHAIKQRSKIPEKTGTPIY